MKMRESIKEEGRNEIGGSEEKRETREHPRIKLVIGLVSNIKEQTSSDFAEDDFFNTTLFLFILLSSKSFPVFV